MLLSRLVIVRYIHTQMYMISQVIAYKTYEIKAQTETERGTIFNRVVKGDLSQEVTV